MIISHIQRVNTILVTLCLIDRKILDIVIYLLGMAHLLRSENSCFEPPRSSFTDMGSIPGQGKIMNVVKWYSSHYSVMLKR